MYPGLRKLAKNEVCNFFEIHGPVSTEIAGQITLQQWWQMSAGFLRALSFMHRNRW